MELRSALIVLLTLALAGCKPQEPEGRSVAAGQRVAAVATNGPEPPAPEAPPPWMRTASLRGQVNGPAGPLAQASVRLWSQLGTSQLDLGQIQTDAQGRFQLEQLPPGATLLQGASPGFSTSRLPLWLEPGSNQAPPLSLQPEALVSGRVLDNQGQPLAAARLLASSVSQPALQLVASSDREGRFTIRGLPPGPVALSAAAAGHQLAAEPQVEAPEQQLILRLNRVFELSGELSGMQPGDQATVWLAGSGVWPARQAAVSASGRFAFAELPEGVYELVARTTSAPWRASQVLAEVVIGPAPPKPLQLALQPAYRLSGEVLAGGRPVPQATVVASPEPLAVLQQQVLTNEKGRFVLLPVPAGSYYLSCWAKGFLPKKEEQIRIPETNKITLNLELGLQISGTVSNKDGYPLEGVTVRAVYSAGGDLLAAPPGPLGELGVVPGPVPPIPPAALASRPSAELGPAALTAVSDRQGEFALRGLPPGRLQLVAEHPDYLRASSRWLEGRPGGKLTRVQLELARGAQLRGTVLDSRKVGLAGAEVVVQGAREARIAYSDEGGRFALSGLERRVRVSVARPGFVPQARQLELNPGKLRRLDLVLASAEGQLLGRVQDGFALPLPAVRVEAHKGEHRVRALTDADGRFHLRELGQPPFTLELIKRGFAPQTLTVGDSKELEITLQQLVRLGGQVLEQRTGTAIGRYSLHLKGPGIERKEEVRDPAGRFLLKDLPPGQLKLVVQAPGFVSSQQVVELPAASDAPGHPLLQVRFELQQAGAAFGQLTDARGAPVAGAELRLAGRRAQTDAAGRWQLEQLPEGTHALEVVTMEQGAVSLDPVVIRARESSGPLRLVLP